MKSLLYFKEVADIFYSPVYNKNVILAPLLTWIEILNESKPIITINVGGDETVDDGETGFIAKNEEDIVNKLFDISLCYKEMKENCYKKVQEKFDIQKVAEEYQNC